MSLPAHDGPRVPVVADVMAVAPLLAPLAAAVWILIGWAAGANPFWPVPDLNVAEAAAVRDHAEVVRLIEAGQDPNRTWRVAPDLIDGSEHALTALEAAVEIRRLELVQLLLRHGARVTPAIRGPLVERARQLGAADIAEFFERLDTRS